MKCTTTAQHLQTLVHPNETIGVPDIIDKGPHTYEVYPIIPDMPDATGNTVLWHVPKETERIHVLGSMTMHMEAVAGRGEVVVYDSRGERRIHEIGPELGGVAIGKGETYYIAATDRCEPVTIRDRAEPPYEQGDELSLTEVSLADIQFHADDKFLIWNPRQPGGAETAGAWWMTILGEHDTTAYNQARAGRAKFRGDPPHWHASAQRVGQGEVWPVNVRMAESELEVRPHWQAHDIAAGGTPQFTVQEDAMILLTIQEVAE